MSIIKPTAAHPSSSDLDIALKKHCEHPSGKFPKSYINAFLEYTKDAESPTSYFRWSAVATIAAALRDNVWLELGLQKIYPNVYILLLSKHSSNTRKSVPLKISLKILREADCAQVLDGRKSFQGLIRRLGKTETELSSDGEEVRFKGGASALLYSEELSANFVEDAQLVDTLTDWFDYHDVWSNTLSNVESIRELRKVCISMLSASNEANIDSLYNQRAAEGGLLARTLVVMESRRRKKNSLMYGRKAASIDPLVDQIRAISSLKGPFSITDDAKAEYDGWYNEIDDDKMSDTGIEGRIPTIILKIAMIYSAAEALDMTITKHHIQKAITDCVDLMVVTKRRMLGQGIQKNAASGKKILNMLWDSPGYQLQQYKVLQQLFGDMTKAEFDDFVEITAAGDIIKKVLIDGEIYLQLSERIIEKYKDNFPTPESSGSPSSAP